MKAALSSEMECPQREDVENGWQWSKLGQLYRTDSLVTLFHRGKVTGWIPSIQPVTFPWSGFVFSTRKRQISVFSHSLSAQL